MFTNLRHRVVAGTAFAICVTASITPANAGANRWTAIGPDGAGVVALAIDPHTSSTVYAGTRSAGVLKTVDAGVTWASTNATLATADIRSLAVDPSTPSTVYAGTDAGVFKSTNGGQTWTAANTGLNQNDVKAIAIDSGSPAKLYAATSAGLFRSVDGASSWTSINLGPPGLQPRVITIDPVSPSTIYIGVDGGDDDYAYGVLKTTDGGMTWSRIYSSMPFGDGGAPSVVAIVIDPSSPSRIFVAFSSADLVKSADGGATWSRLNPPRASLVTIAIDPASPSTLYAGTYFGEIFRTTDSGEHWAPVFDRAPSINVIALAASVPATVYAGGGTGIYQSTDAGQSWAHRILGVRNIGLSPLAVDPTSSSTIYGASGTSIAKSTDGGVHWTDARVATVEGFVAALQIDPASPSILYAGLGQFSNSGTAVYKSIDGGANWAPATSGLLSNYVRALAIAPSRTATLYVGIQGAGVLKTVDAGASWTAVNNGLTAIGIYISALAVDPTNADIVYVATPPTGRPDTNAKIFKSTNGAAQWRQVAELSLDVQITSLVVDPVTPSIIYVSYDDYATDLGGILKSSDSGETWAEQPQRPPSRCCVKLAINPGTPSQIYAATPDGIFRSNDGAASWAAFNDGLPTLGVADIAIDHTGSLLRAGTGVGVFEYRFTNSTASTVVEYQNTQDFLGSPGGQFFYSDDSVEQAEVDSGSAGRFIRTGRTFKSGGTKLLCRFYGSVAPGPNAHFYTISDEECDRLKSLQRVPTPVDVQQWNYEGLSFAGTALQVGAAGTGCPAGTVPVFRGYNNAYPLTGPKNAWDSVHRYSTNQADIQQLVAQYGWRDEGIAFCSPQ